MAGRPTLNALCAEIERDGGEEAFFERMASGETIVKIAGGYGVSPGLLYKWKKMPGHVERRTELWKEAQKQSAEVYADQSVQILDDLAEKAEEHPILVTSQMVQLGSSRSNARWRMAEARDPETFGAKKDQVNINFNLGMAHLEALKNFGKMDLNPVRKQVEGPVKDAELLDEGGEEDEVADAFNQ